MAHARMMGAILGITLRGGPLLAAVMLAIAWCCSTQSGPPRYRVTGDVRASCYGGSPTVPQTSCAVHAQIQNEGGHGPGGSGELIVYYRAAGSRAVTSAQCVDTFPALGNEDIAELDCDATGSPPIYSNRVVGTALKLRPRRPS